MPAIRENLWGLALGGQPIDAAEWAAALADQAAEPDPDFRTRLLLRDGLDALARYWGPRRIQEWLRSSPAGPRLREFWADPLGPAGFPSLTKRVMDATKPDAVLAFLRELGTRLPQPARLDVGGSIALILRGYLSRHTEDVNVVDEEPEDVRSRHELLNELAASYGLRLTHFQSHYLPSEWRERVKFFDRFGQLDVYLVDAYDIFVGKLFSGRRKDRDDNRDLAGRLDKEQAADRLRSCAGALRSDPKLADYARDNWYIVYGVALAEPPATPGGA